MLLAWTTDIHLDFLGPREVQDFCDEVGRGKPDALLITGDISVAPMLEAHLLKLETALRIPIYFVLGNHDFYGSSINEVRGLAKRVSSGSMLLRWLSSSVAIPLSTTTGLLGHDGWSDGRFGDYENSGVMLNDYVRIKDLAGLDRGERLRKLNELGDEAAKWVRGNLPLALDRFQHVLFLTHPPPFREACWHEGAISDDDHLPHFSCKAVGDALREAAEKRPDRRITVLCGHTHSPGEARILPNLLVKTGAAEYGAPRVQETFEI